MGRRTLLLGSVAVAVIAAGALVAVFALRSNGTAAPPLQTVMGAARTANTLRGIEQHGTLLGSSTAPVTLVVFADPQCPFCGEWERNALAPIVERYVRTGKVRILFNGMAFVGADSSTALRTALAAGSQNRFWNVIELLFENQGVENAGWVTEPLLRAIGGAVPGLDTEKMLAERNSSVVDGQITSASALAQALGVTRTPSFGVGPTGGDMQIVPVSSLDAAGLTPALDAALAQ